MEVDTNKQINRDFRKWLLNGDQTVFLGCDFFCCLIQLQVHRLRISITLLSILLQWPGMLSFTWNYLTTPPLPPTTNHFASLERQKCLVPIFHLKLKMSKNWTRLHNILNSNICKFYFLKCLEKLKIILLIWKQHSIILDYEIWSRWFSRVLRMGMIHWHCVWEKKYCLTQVVYRTKLYRLKLLLLHNFLLRRQPQKLEKIMTIKSVWVQLN